MARSIRQVYIERVKKRRLAIVSVVFLLVTVAGCGKAVTPTPSATPGSTPAPTVAVGPLDHIVLSPETAALAPGDYQQFSAKAFDQRNNKIKSLSFKWVVVKGGGRIDDTGFFIAGDQAGAYPDTIKVEATQGGVSRAATATVAVTAPPLAPVVTPVVPGPVPGWGYLIYEDDFSSNLGGWEEVSAEDHKAYLADGVYNVLNPSGSWYTSSSDRSLSRLNDFSLEVDLAKISGPDDSRYGISFKIGNTEQMGFILVSPKGTVCFWKDKPGGYMNSIVVFERPITTGQSLERARLRVERQGSTWKVSVNGSLVASVSDTSEPITKLSFEVLGNNLNVTFDNLKVYTPALPVAPTPPSGFPVFFDSFDGWNQGWPFYGKPEKIYFRDGNLCLSPGNDEFVSTFNARIPRTTSFAYQAELSFPKATPQTQGELFVRRENGIIRLRIDPSRQFRVDHYVPGGKSGVLIEKTFAPALKGGGDINKVLVVGRGSSLEVYANDVFLRSCSDPYPSSAVTEIGLTALGAGSQVAFDNVMLYSLSPLPSSALQPLAEKLPQVKCDMDTTKRVFAIFALLNTAGYDEGKDGYDFAPMRVRIRDALAGVDPALLQKIRDYYEERRKAGLGDWTTWNSYGFSLDGLGPFEETQRTEVRLKGTAPLLNEFYLKANLEELWDEVEPEYWDRVVAELPQLCWAGADVSAYLHQPLPADDIFYYVPNFLAAYGSWLYHTYGSQVFITLTPHTDAFSFREDTRYLFLFVHSVLKPALEKNAAVIKAKEQLFEQVPQSVRERGFDTWSHFVEQCLEQAITIRMAAIYDPAWRTEHLTESDLRDFFLIEPFLQALKGYEVSDMPFDEYVPQILQAIP